MTRAAPLSDLVEVAEMLRSRDLAALARIERDLRAARQEREALRHHAGDAARLFAVDALPAAAVPMADRSAERLGAVLDARIAVLERAATPARAAATRAVARHDVLDGLASRPAATGRAVTPSGG